MPKAPRPVSPERRNGLQVFLNARKLRELVLTVLLYSERTVREFGMTVKIADHIFSSFFKRFQIKLSEFNVSAGKDIFAQTAKHTENLKNRKLKCCIVGYTAF